MCSVYEAELAVISQSLETLDIYCRIPSALVDYSVCIQKVEGERTCCVIYPVSQTSVNSVYYET